MDLSIIIINWNSSRYLRKCLDSIYKQPSTIPFETIVVDNASYDGCGNMLKNEFPSVRFVQSDRNLGFSGGNNLGYSHSTGQVLLFLNPDTEICGNALTDLYSTLLSTPDAGAIGGKLLNTNGSLQTSCILPFPTIMNQVLDIEKLKLKFPSLNFWGIKPLFSKEKNDPDVEALSGACLMVKRDVFEKAGAFCTDYFMYCEDVNLCFKIKRAGAKVLYLEQAQVVHHGGGSSKESREKHFNSVLMRESIYIFLTKYHSPAYARLYRHAITLASLLRLAFFAAALPAFGKASLVKWFKILSWSMGFEPWVKKLQYKTAL